MAGREPRRADALGRRDRGVEQLLQHAGNHARVIAHVVHAHQHVRVQILLVQRRHLGHRTRQPLGHFGHVADGERCRRAVDDIEQALDLNEYLIRNENATFIVKANSLSMLDAGIDINDPLIVDRSIPAKSGDIVIALIDNDFTVKRLMIDSQFKPPKVWLKAENPDYQNIYIEEGQELVIWGVVTYNLKRMR